MMVILGTDAHKRSHTVVACDEVGTEIGTFTVSATPQGHLRLVKWGGALYRAAVGNRGLSGPVPSVGGRSVASRGTGGAGCLPS